MSEQKPISHADLARYWGCSPANVSNLVKRKAMPEFTSLRAADEWRAVNAPLRKPRQTAAPPPVSSPKRQVESAEKSFDSSATTTPAGTTEKPPAPAAPSPPRSAPPEAPPERIDVSKFVDHDADFILLQLRNANELSQITYGLLKRKTEEGEPGAIAAAAKNWHEASKVAADVVEKFIAIQREAGALISIDDVEDVIATELEEIRKGLKRLGRRAGAAANPANPTLAEKAIDGEVDQLLAAFNNLIDRAKLELRASAEAAEPAAAGAS